MKPWALLSAIATASVFLASPARLVARGSVSAPAGASSTISSPQNATPDSCAEGTLPDGPVCVHLTHNEGVSAAALRTVHREHGEFRAYDQIPKLPDRPEPYDEYAWPVEGAHASSGYDLDAPDESQRRINLRGTQITGHGGLDLIAPRGAPVRAISLERQAGPMHVIYTGPLFGTTVVLAHSVVTEGRTQTYLVLYGHLESIAPGIAGGEEVAAGTEIGRVGDSGSPGIVHLHLEVRRLREGVALDKVAAGPSIVSETVSVPCDPRNVLPLRSARHETP